MKQISDWFCNCRLKTTVVQTRNVALSNTDNTCLEGTSASCAMVRTRSQINDRLSFRQHQYDYKRGSNKCCNGTTVLLSNKTFDKDIGVYPRRLDKSTPSSLHNRRPSGLPLVNRRMTPNDVIMLETYRRQRDVCEMSDTSIISNTKPQTNYNRCKTVNLNFLHGTATNV